MYLPDMNIIYTILLTNGLKIEAFYSASSQMAANTRVLRRFDNYLIDNGLRFTAR